jgi:peroxiredoxin-like protein
MDNSQTHTYEVNLRWDSERKGTLSSPVLPTEIEVATPPDIWSPEHLFVGAVNSCLMATFLAVAENSKFDFISFECNAVGIVETVDKKLMVTRITLKPKVVIQSIEHEEQLKKILEMSEKQCLISNSITTKISLEPIITIF